MVDQIKELSLQIKKERGDIYLLALLQMDELIDIWSIIISAPWITEQNRGKSFIYIRDKVAKLLTIEQMNSIARLGVFTKDIHIVEELMKYKVGTEFTHDRKVNGNVVHAGYIIASNSDASEQVELNL